MLPAQPQRKKTCVSIAYNKPAKTGSTTVGKILQQQFPKAKRVDCGKHSEHTSLGKLRLPENAEYDIFDCHSIWDASTMAALVQQAKHPIVRVTTIRDPVDQLVSLFFHLRHGRVCNTGKVPTAKDMEAFVKRAYYPRVKSFHSRPYDVSQLSAKLVTEECAFWDVIWQTDELETVLNSAEHANTAKAECPERDEMMNDRELLDVLVEATKGERVMFEGLRKCQHVRNNTPWVWDEEQGCIAEV